MLENILKSDYHHLDISRTSFPEKSLEFCPAYSLKELSQIRNSLKLVSKFYFGNKSTLDNETAESLLRESTNLGINLAISGAPSEIIAAGFLYNSLRLNCNPDWDKDINLREDIVRRKFGEKVLEHIDRANLDPNYFSSLINESASHYSKTDRNKLISALEMAQDTFQGVPRKWGTNEYLPLSTHATEVGLILICASCSVDQVIAGFHHDIFENYVDTPQQILREKVSTAFGERVIDIISNVTEPAKSNSEGNWWERKRAVLSALLIDDKESLSVAAAAKISTLAAGNKVLYERHPVSKWSAGTFKQNLLFHETLGRLFELSQIPELIQHAYNNELSLFASWEKAHESHDTPDAYTENINLDINNLLSNFVTVINPGQ